MRILHKLGELSQEKFEYLLRGPKVGRRLGAAHLHGRVQQELKCLSVLLPPLCLCPWSAGCGASQPSARMATRVQLAVSAGAEGNF